MGGAGTTFTAGQSHHWRDDGAEAGAAYWVEEVDLHGARTWYGPAISHVDSESVANADSVATAQALQATSRPTQRANAKGEVESAVALSDVGRVSGANAASVALGGASAKTATTPSAASPQAVAEQYALAAGAAVRMDVQAEGCITRPSLNWWRQV